jgi:hypothetical protein
MVISWCNHRAASFGKMVLCCLLFSITDFVRESNSHISVNSPWVGNFQFLLPESALQVLSFLHYLVFTMVSLSVHEPTHEYDSTESLGPGQGAQCHVLGKCPNASFIHTYFSCFLAPSKSDPIYTSWEPVRCCLDSSLSVVNTSIAMRCGGLQHLLSGQLARKGGGADF